MRNRYIKGTKNPELNAEIIERCRLQSYSSKYKILEHFYHVDTYFDDAKCRLQGYIYPEDVYSEGSLASIYVPECDVSYMDDRLILFFSSIVYPLFDPLTDIH